MNDGSAVPSATARTDVDLAQIKATFRYGTLTLAGDETVAAHKRITAIWKA